MVERTKRSVSRRTVLKSVGAGAATTSLAGCISSLGGSDSLDLALTIAGGSWGEWVEEYFVVPWEEESGHDIDVQFNAADAQTSKMQANKDDPIWDLAHSSQTDAIQYGQQDLILKHSEHVSKWEDVSPAFKNEWLAGKVATPFGIGYNTDQTSMDVTSWNDLLDSEFSGKVAVPAWGWIGSAWVYVVNDVLGGSVDDISPALDYVGQLLNENDGVIMETTDHGLRLFQNEEIWIAPFWTARTDQVALNSDVNTKFVYPEEGAASWVYNLALVGGRGDANREAAADFIDSTFNAERQGQFSADIGYPPTVPEAVEHIPDDVKESRPSLNITQTDMDNMAKIDVDWTEVAQYREQHAEEWRRVVSG